MIQAPSPAQIALLLVIPATAAACVTDIRSRRIPNALVAALIASALGLHAAQGWISLIVCIAVFAAVFAAGTLAFSFGIAGGGDVKLAAACAMIFAPPQAAEFLLYTFLCGGILAIAVSLFHGRLAATLRNASGIGTMILHGVRPGLPSVVPARLPYALAFFAGAVLVSLSQTLFPTLRLFS